MDPFREQMLVQTRRELFQRLGSGIGGIALSSLLNQDALAAPTAEQPQAVRPPNFAAGAKHVIYLHMVGAPSQLDLLDYKPALAAHDGQPVPRELIEGQAFAFLRGHPNLLGTRYGFQKHGKSGIEFSELLPHLAQVADDITVVKSLHTEEFNHAPAQLFIQTGSARLGWPSIGAWVTYGLGSENENLPAFVVMITGDVTGPGNSLWGSGFLPTTYQATEFRSSGDPVLFLSNPKGISHDDRRRMVNHIQHLNRVQLADAGDPEIATRIAQYEMAYRMQMSVPELTDISREPMHIHEMYGTTPGEASFANHCLLARRLVERGVRFVQIYNGNWDHHNDLFTKLPVQCREIDQPAAALIMDLKQRGLLDETLVVWGGEFGRTPMVQKTFGPNPGRDHHKDAFCIWLAGGGVKPGLTFGATDDLGYQVVEDPVHVRDFHATMLHLLGIKHEKLTFKFQGRQFRLTNVGGKVVHQLLA